MKQAISYLRRSTRNQEGSFDIQRNFISQFAKQHDYQIINEFKDTKTGRNNLRDGLEASLSYLADHEDIYLILWKVDRLARNLKALGDIVEPLLPRLRFVELGDSAPNLFVISTLSVLAKAESDTISQRVRAAYQTSKENNPDHRWGNAKSLVHGRKTSLENRRMKSREHFEKISKFIAYIDPERTKPISHIACELNDLGITTIRGNKFTGWSLKKLIEQHS